MSDIRTVHKQLTQWHKHRQPYTFEGEMSSWDTYHETEVPPLLQQLDNADKRPAELDQTGGTPGSRPAANIEAVDTLAHIDNEAAAWVRRLGGDDPGSTIACVNRVYALAASAEFCQRPAPVIEEAEIRIKVGDEWTTRTRKVVTCCDVHRIERDMRQWWTSARLCSGWDSKPWRPNNTCPVCSERRTLRIRVDDHAAMCTNCRETWSEGTIGLLAEHVRRENGEDEVVA